jgi:hypothetical protein
MAGDVIRNLLQATSYKSLIDFASEFFSIVVGHEIILQARLPPPRARLPPPRA